MRAACPDVEVEDAHSAEQVEKAGADTPLHFLCLVPVTRDCGEPVPGS